MKPFQHNQPLAKGSTFGIGGTARYFVAVDTIEELQEALREADRRGLSVHILGKGSNSLFSDQGFDGLVIHNRIAFLEIENASLYVGAGCSFSLLGSKTARLGLSGLEFASGIPASVGGAIYMNAGADGQETAECLDEVTYVTQKGEVQILQARDLAFSYRTSSFHHMRGAIAAARFSLTPDDKARSRQLAIIAKRTKTQPGDELSCGCVFRNPEGASAGKLIEECGLKGVRRGGALVSELHANFILNAGGATAEDVRELARYIQTVVKKKTNIDLEFELREIPSSYDPSLSR